MRLDRSIKSPDGTQIFYRIDRGEDPCIVLLHGWVLNHTALEGVRKGLSKYTTLTLDVRGHGKSKSESLSLDLAAQDLSAILKKEKINQVVLVGYSLGGMIAQRYYTLEPKKVKGLVLINTNFINPAKTIPVAATRIFKDFISRLDKSSDKKGQVKNTFKEMLSRASSVTKAARLAYDKAHGSGKGGASIDFMKLKDKKDVDVFYEGLAATDFHAAERYYHEQALLDNTEQLSKIKAPCMVISSTGDIFCPVEAAKEMARKIPSCELHILKGSDHLTILQQTAAINKLITRFLSKDL